MTTIISVTADLPFTEYAASTFTDGDGCPNIGWGSSGSVDECIQSCRNKEGCTGVNFSPTVPDCVMRGCPVPVPAPSGETLAGGYSAYAVEITQGMLIMYLLPSHAY